MLKTIYRGVLRMVPATVPSFVKYRADTERRSIDQFMERVVVPQLTAHDRVLDAGAGPQRYKKLLSFTRYESTDFEDVFDKGSKGRHDFVCSLDDIPKPDGSYDAIINTQVLEHVLFPEKVVEEFYRILKPGGKLFLTTNQTFWRHHSPYNYYFFTDHALRALFLRAGFRVQSIAPRGGIFWFLAKLFNYAPSHIYYQLVYGGHKRDESFVPKMQNPLRAFVLLPFYVIAEYSIGFFLPFVFFYLDRFDRQKDITLGYACVCEKP